VYIPSFGEWGFVLARRGPYEPPDSLPAGLRYLTPPIVAQAFAFPRDMAPVADVRPNRLNDQILVRYYAEDFDRINR
jgi:spermidine synthase